MSHDAETKTMTRRTRLAIGLLGLLVWLTFYAILALIGGVALHEAVAKRSWGWLVEAAYYVVAGLAWALPLRGFMRWMNRPDPGEEHSWPK